MEKILNYRFSTSFTIKGLLQASVVGIEFYDFMVFIMLAKYISISFFEGSDYFRIMATYVIMAIGYISKPLGGVILSHFGDKHGRKPIFVISIIIMAICTFIIGIIPTYAMIGMCAPILLLIARVVQGLALGGELPGAITFVYEHMPKSKRMFGIGILLFGVYVGVFLGSFIPYLLGFIYSENEIISYAWRIPFIIGGIFGVIGLYIRKDMRETPIFAHIKIQKKFFSIPLKEVLKCYKLEILCTFLLTFTFESMLVFFHGLLPSFLSVNLNYSYQQAFRLSSLINIIAVFAYLFIGFLFFRYVIKQKSFLIIVYIIAAVLSTIFLANLSALNFKYISLISIFLVLILTVGNIMYKTILPEMYEARCRFTGTSLTFNIGNGLAGGLTPLVITWLMHNYHKNIFPGYYLALTSLIGIITVLLIKFTQNRRKNQRALEYSRVRIRDVKEIMTKDQKEFYDCAKGRKLNMRELDAWELEEIINSLPADQRQFYREKHNIK